LYSSKYTNPFCLEKREMSKVLLRFFTRQIAEYR
jgi:hypothetical protein